jgi:CHAT domain-containing protein
LGGIHFGGGVKKIILFISLMFYSNLNFSQDLEKIILNFLDAEANKNDKSIIFNGKILLDYFDKNNLEIDSNICFVSLTYGISLANLGEFEKSKNHFLITKQKIEQSNKFSITNIDYPIILSWIAFNNSKLGIYNNAIEFYESALLLYEKSIGKDNEYYSNCLTHLSLNYYYNDEINKSLESNFENLQIIEKIKGENHMDYAQCLHYIASNYLAINNFKNALEYYLVSLEITKNVIGTESDLYYLRLNNVAISYLNLGDYKKSLECLLNAEKYYEKKKFNKDENYFTLLNNISACYIELGDLEISLLYNRKIQKKIKNKQSLDYLICLNNFGQIYSDKKDPENSLKYYKKALELANNIYGNDHSIYLNILDNLSANYSDLKLFDVSFDSILSSNNKTLVKFKNQILGLDYFTSTVLKQDLEYQFEFLTALALKNENNKIEKVFRQWIQIHGLLNGSFKPLNKVLSEKHQDVISILRKLKSEYYAISEFPIENRNKNILDSIKNRIIEIEMYFTRESDEFRNLQKLINFNDIIYELKENETYIDILKVPKYNFNINKWTYSTQYLVFITDSKDTLVDYVFIEDGTKIDQDLFDQYNQEVTNPEQKTDLKSEKFYNYFWKPIADKIGDAKTIYVSLGGVYNNINLNTIYNPTTGKYLIEEKDIRIVNSARDFVLSKESEKKNYTSNTASLFGFPNFDGNTSVTADTSDLFASTRDLNSFWLDSLTRGGMKAKPLPATKTEVENISSTLKSKGWQVNSFLADNASETNIKKQQSPRILHVATHGYFFQDIPMEKDNNRFLGMDRQQVVQDPMLRSGLLLTGANKTLKGETTTGENGLLSAAEASLLDLRETELVVLSACETAKGEVRNSEGVYGLRKAFSDAGAQNIIMSLWKVDDKVTQEFMARFYEIWLNEKTSIREAFNKTQLEIKAKYPQPYYWGAFILVGE